MWGFPVVRTNIDQHLSTGATRVFCQNHVIRKQSWETSRQNEGHHHELTAQEQPSSFRSVHVDYSPDGAKAVLGFFLPEDSAKLSRTRW